LKCIVVLVNPLLERRKRRDVSRVLKVLRESGAEVLLRETPPDHGAAILVQEALEWRPDAVFVCGGDGTVFDAVQGLVGSKVPLGVVPFGTGNILVQNLKIPRNPESAVRDLLSARPREIRMGKVTCGADMDSQRSWFFLIASGMGLHASLLGASQAWGKRFSGQLAYYMAGVDILLRHQVQPFECEMTTTDGRTLRRTVCEAMALNVAELNRWRPNGSLVEPWLRLVTVAGASRGALARASWDAIVRSSHAEQSDDLSNGGAAYVNVVRAQFRPIPDMDYRSSLEVEADGEVLGTSTATMEVAKESLMVLSPGA
jgi:diacylglycerol kinase family enzyme